MATTLGILAWLQVLDFRSDLGPFHLKRFDLLSGLRTSLPPQDGPPSWRDPGIGNPATAKASGISPAALLADPAAALPEDPAAPNPLPAERFAVVDSLPIPGITEFVRPNGWGGLRDIALRVRNARDQSGKLVRNFRIIHYGDSMLEGDLISQDLRRSFQDSYGGSGVGLMGMTSITADFRGSIQHRFSADWTDVNLTKRAEGVPLGPMGHTWMPKPTGGLPLEVPELPGTQEETDALLALASDSSWTSFEVAAKGSSPEPFQRLRFFYDGVESWALLIMELDGVPYFRRLSPGQGLQTARFNLGAVGVQKATLKILCPGQVRVYGLSLDSPTGVHVDNISFRGSNGQNFAAVDQGILQAMGKELGWNLAILEFGLNVADPLMEDFAAYRTGMSNFADILEGNIPEIALLIIGTYDLALRGDSGEMVSSPAVPLLCYDQARLAKQHYASFWNLYRVLGGSGSMVKMQAEGLANRDFTHLSAKGAKLVGEQMYGALSHALLN